MKMNWKYFGPKFEYEEVLQDIAWPWAGHKNFAYDLIANVKPRRVVELGTHYGTSFWCFSQAAKDLNLDIELNAIDHWHGEKHAGFYGEEVYETVIQIKNKYYSNVKINLIRKNFDEALREFADNSIDILHIDGLHTYEAVKNDFESWLPKISEDGIVLFHDIVVSRDDFGVYQLWDELKKRYATIEFRHSYGLGVLFKQKHSRKLIAMGDIEVHYACALEDFENSKFSQMLHEQMMNKIMLKEKEQELKEKDAMIAFVCSSKFWKIRSVYIKYRSKLLFLFLSPQKFINKYSKINTVTDRCHHG